MLTALQQQSIRDQEKETIDGWIPEFHVVSFCQLPDPSRPACLVIRCVMFLFPRRSELRDRVSDQ